ncbi:MAG: nicotinamide mononucleotide transporter, partial [Bacteroidales bacterium]|nr:nicotinamide mononucleotide transporter [Bacteroidales bacterium]
SLLPDSGGQGAGYEKANRLPVSRLDLTTGIILTGVFILIYVVMWLILSNLTDSPVPAWDSFITSLSIIATWMLARKIYEHWYLWVIVNIAAAVLFFTRGLYPTVILYIVYCAMSFVGLTEWKKSLKKQL